MRGQLLLPSERTAEPTLLNTPGQPVQARSTALGTQLQVDVSGLAASVYTLRIQTVAPWPASK